MPVNRCKAVGALNSVTLIYAARLSWFTVITVAALVWTYTGVSGLLTYGLTVNGFALWILLAILLPLPAVAMLAPALLVFYPIVFAVNAGTLLQSQLCNNAA